MSALLLGGTLLALFGWPLVWGPVLGSGEDLGEPSIQGGVRLTLNNLEWGSQVQQSNIHRDCWLSPLDPPASPAAAGLFHAVMPPGPPRLEKRPPLRGAHAKDPRQEGGGALGRSCGACSLAPEAGPRGPQLEHARVTAAE